MYKNLFIDLDDTIWSFTENSKDSFLEVYDLYNFNRYFDSFEQFFDIYIQNNHKAWEKYGKGEITKDELNQQRFAYPLQIVGINDPELITNYQKKIPRTDPYKKQTNAICKRSVGISCFLL